MNFKELYNNDTIMSEIREYIEEHFRENTVFDVDFKESGIIGYIYDLGLFVNKDLSTEDQRDRLLLFANLYSEQLYLYVQSKIKHLDLNITN